MHLSGTFSEGWLSDEVRGLLRDLSSSKLSCDPGHSHPLASTPSLHFQPILSPLSIPCILIAKPLLLSVLSLRHHEQLTSGIIFQPELVSH